MPWVKVVDGDGEHERLLPNVRHLSPVGFEWGYHGVGPLDLAYSILHEHVGAEPMATLTAQEYAGDFAARVIAQKRDKNWTLTEAEISEALFVIKRERPVAAVVELEYAV